MTYQRIRLRTDIFQSQELALMEERTDGVPLNMILPEPVPSIRNEMFNQINEPEVICLGTGRDLICDYNDNHSSKDLPNPSIKDIQGKIIDDEQSLEEVKKKKELVGQINKSIKTKNQLSIESWKELQNKGIDFVNGSFSCLVCEIGFQIGNLDTHLQGKRHAKGVKAPNEKKKKELKIVKKRARRQEEKAKKLNEVKQIDGSEVICLGNGKDCDDNDKNQVPLTEKELTELNNKGIDFVNGSFSCSVCKIGLKKDSIYSHLQGKRHVTALVSKIEISSREFIVIKEIKSGWMRQICSLCNVGTSGENDIQSHLSGRKHKLNYDLAKYISNLKEE